MRRLFHQAAGGISLALALAGVFLPLLPTVPFLLLAAFFFARGNPAWERRLLEHPRYGPPILAWRQRGAISRRGKIAALVTLGISAALGLCALEAPWRWVPLGVAVICGGWIGTRPRA